MDEDQLKNYYPIVKSLLSDDLQLNKLFILSRVKSQFEGYSTFDETVNFLSVVILTPVSMYKELGDEIEVKGVEKRIQDTFRIAMKGVNDLVVENVIIKPYSEETVFSY